MKSDASAPALFAGLEYFANFGKKGRLTNFGVSTKSISVTDISIKMIVCDEDD
jgi:hypothetical protein